MSRLMITGTHSGCGKTTVTCALLAALKHRGLGPAAFKCGPDYIDPMFHRRAIGVPARNLDPFFSTGEQLRQQLTAHGGGLALLEGAMGYYDGVGPQGEYSAHQVARETRTPAVLVVDARGMYASAGAVLQGFSGYRAESMIAGVIFNHASPMLYEGLRAIADQVGVRAYGFLPREPGAAIESRHLGLVTAVELSDLEEKLRLLGSLAEAHLDIDDLLELAASTPPLDEKPPEVRPLGSVRVAVAWDEAFCFLYEENLERLAALGCELTFFSPLSDRALPQGAAALYLCGGYPELHLDALSGNRAMLNAVNRAIRGGMPTIAECGGFLYLHETLDGRPMAGVIPAAAHRGERLGPFGYFTLRAEQDSLLCARGESLRAHEFHYYASTDCGASFAAEKPLSGRRHPCVHGTDTLYAGFPHLYFDANPSLAERFVRKAVAYAADNLT